MTKDEKPPQAEGWSVDTALQHVLSLIGANDHRYEQRFLDQERSVTTAMAAAKEAVLKAENAAERRFEGINEFRAALGDQQRTLMPRTEAEEKFRTLEKQLDALARTVSDRVAERRGVAGGWGYAVGVSGFVFLIISLVVLALNSVP